jgi:hypothetical protein
MIPTEQLYKKIADLTAGIKQEFRAKGIVLPARNAQGIKLDNYTVVKNDHGYYSILNSKGAVVYDNINLSYSAVIIANNLALGRHADPKILEQDRNYGYCSFDEDNFKRISLSAAKKKDWDRAETLMLKQNLAHERAVNAKKYVLSSFEKLRQLR